MESFLFTKKYDTMYSTERSLEENIMSEMYKEQLVKRRKDKKDVTIKFALSFATILSICIFFFFPIGIIIPIVLAIVDVIVFRRMDVEFEYIYTSGDLDIDKIIHKEKRKRVLAVNVKDMEIMAVEGSSELAAHKDAQVCDFTTHTPGAKVYEMVVIDNGEKKRVLFEPDEELVEGIWTLTPRKTIR